MKEGCELTDSQKKIFRDLEELFGGEEDRGWKHLKSPNEGVKMEMKTQQQEKGERSISLGRAKCIADCTAEVAAAWYFEYCSRERQNTGQASGDLARIQIRQAEGKANEKVFATVKTMPFPLKNREFVGISTIFTNPDTKCLQVFVMPDNQVVDYGGTFKSLVRGKVFAIFTARNIVSLGEVAQCKISLKQSVDAGGFVPRKVVDRKIPQSLKLVSELQHAFKRDEDVDRAALASLANIIRNEKQHYTEEEQETIRKGKEFNMKCKESKKFKDLKSPDPQVKMKAGHLEGESLVIGLCESIIDASLAECAAYEFIKDSRERKAKIGEKYKALTFKVPSSQHDPLVLSLQELELLTFLAL